jgi:hypothetical protein
MIFAILFATLWALPFPAFYKFARMNDTPGPVWVSLLGTIAWPFILVAFILD